MLAPRPELYRTRRRRRFTIRGGTSGSRHPHGHHRASLPIRVRQRLRERSVAGRAARRAKQSAAAAVRPLHRRDQRHELHGAARREPALLDVPDSAVGRARAVSRDLAPGSFAARRSTRRPRRRISCAGGRCRIPKEPTDFVAGLVTMGGNGDPAQQTGAAVHLYAANASMVDRFFYDADGELLDRAAARRADGAHRARHPARGARRDSASCRAA